MSQGIFTPHLRFEWKKGEVTTSTPAEGFVACGPETLYCAEVTSLDMLCEFFYRARSARFSPSASSQIEMSYVDSGGRVGGYVGFSGDSDELVDGSGDIYTESAFLTKRGYHLEYTSPDVIPPEISGYFSEGYSKTPNAQDFYDTLSYESNMWREEMEDSGNVKTAFTHYARSVFVEGTSEPSSTGYAIRGSTFGAYPMIRWDFTLTLVVKPYVAWVVDPLNESPETATPLSPGTRWFIAVKVDIDLFTNNANPFVGYADAVSSEKNLYSAYNHGDLSVTIKLESGDIVIPLLSANDPSLGGADPTTVGNLDLVVEEWWPYAKGNPSIPVWNSATGVKL